MLVDSKGVLRIAGDSLTIVNTGIISTGNVCVVPNFMTVGIRNKNNRSFGRYARRTFRDTVTTRVGRNTAAVFPALSSSPGRSVYGTISVYRGLVTRGSNPMLKLRIRKPCLGTGVTNGLCSIGGPSGRRCVSVLRDAGYVGH